MRTRTQLSSFHTHSHTHSVHSHGATRKKLIKQNVDAELTDCLTGSSIIVGGEGEEVDSGGTRFRIDTSLCKI